MRRQVYSIASYSSQPISPLSRSIIFPLPEFYDLRSSSCRGCSRMHGYEISTRLATHCTLFRGMLAMQPSDLSESIHFEINRLGPMYIEVRGLVRIFGCHFAVSPVGWPGVRFIKVTKIRCFLRSHDEFFVLNKGWRQKQHCDFFSHFYSGVGISWKM